MFVLLLLKGSYLHFVSIESQIYTHKDYFLCKTYFFCRPISLPLFLSVSSFALLIHVAFVKCISKIISSELNVKRKIVCTVIYFSFFCCCWKEAYHFSFFSLRLGWTMFENSGEFGNSNQTPISNYGDNIGWHLFKLICLIFTRINQ